MANIEPRGVKGAGIFVRIAYWMARRRIGRVPIPMGIMAHHRRVLLAAGGFEVAFEGAKDVPIRLKDLASLKAATIVGCRFCIDIGASLARTHGVTEAELRDLPVCETSTHFTPLEQRVLAYAVCMTETPLDVPRELFDALEHELGVPALVELTASIAWENFRARFNHAFGAREEGYSQGTLCLLPPPETATPTAAHA